MTTTQPHTTEGDLEKQTSSGGTSLAEHDKPFHETPFDAAAEAEAEVEQPAEKPAAPPGPQVASFANVPDGGWVAWSQVIGSFFLFFNTW